MKPLTLKIEGLRSYRDEVVIDFAWLAEQGLFGIVGPTGAGKSTVLDAMFLALYGSTPRSGRTVTEFVHPEAAAAAVDLSFSLLRAGETQVWRVRREWRRKKRGAKADDFAQPRAELWRLHGALESLAAEGVNEVNGAITTQVLGIPFEDFRKAIVLPQGEFDRLLRTAAGERAQLLGRVFGLSRLGKPLLIAASTRRNELERQVEALKLRKAAREVSQERLDELRSQAAASVEAREAARTTLTAAESQAEAAGRGRELADRLETAQRDAEAVGARAAEVDASRAALAAAARAQTALPAIDREAQEAARAAQTEERRRTREAQQTAAQAEEQRWAERSAQAARALEEREPALRSELEAVRRAVAQAKEAEAHEARAAGARAAEKQALQSIAALDERRTVREERRRELEASTQAADEELKRTRVSSAEREAADAALDAAGREARAREAVAVADGDVRTRQQAVERAGQAEQEAARKKEQSALALAGAQADEALKIDLAAVERAGHERRVRYDAVRELVRRLAEEEKGSEEVGLREGAAAQRVRETQAAVASARTAAEAAAGVTEKARRAAEEAVQRRAAVVASSQAVMLAAKHLTSGEPCPVCGSCQHPSPARDELGALEDAEREDKAAQEAKAAAEKRLEQARDVLSRAEAAHEQAQATLAERRAERHERLERINALVEQGRATLPDVPWEAPADVRDQHVQALAKELETLRARFGTERKALEAARERLSAAEKADALAQAALESVRAQAQAAGNELAAARARLAEATAALESGLAAWAAAHKGASLADAQAQLERLRVRDRRAQQLEEQLARAREQVQAIEAQAREDEQARSDALGRLASARTEAESEARQAAALREQVEAVTGGRPAAALLERLEAELAALANEAKEARTGWEKARGAWQAACAAFAEVSEELERANASLAEARAQAAKALADSGFESAAQVRAHVLTPDRRAALDQQVRAHDERRAQVQAALEQAQEAARAHGAPLPTADEATQAQALRGQARAAFEAALSQAQRLATELAQAEADVKEGAALQAEIVALTPQFSRAELLATLLRGEKLVAFAAERHLTRILASATGNLRLLSSGRYELMCDEGGEFAVRDRHQAGALRRASTLSGGESFLVSLALALALSDHIQQQGSVRFDFFFLDEGFGSLDEQTLAVAIDALERLRGMQRTIGTISHVPALHERLPRRLVVNRAPAGGSATISLEA